MSTKPETKSLVERMAQRFGVDAKKFFETLKLTAFKQRDGSAPTDEQMMALLIVAEQYNLNPFTREIYAFPDKSGGIVPVVGVDGWSRIANEHKQFDGVEFEYSENLIEMPGAKVKCPEWVECIVYRKDRTRSIRIREYLDEVYRPPVEATGQYGPYTVIGPWQTHTKRQLRHKGFIQGLRIGLGFSGIYDQDEAERIIEGEAHVVSSEQTTKQPAVIEASSPLALEHKKKMDPLLKQLADRAIAQNAWSATHEYVESRFSGAELEYAVQYLRDAEIDSMEPAVTQKASIQEKGNVDDVQSELPDEPIQHDPEPLEEGLHEPDPELEEGGDGNYF
ncbi:phage recombination protein Bet [Vibrio parahaemolyticus]|nr:phage recombination protein Bet [Vibrio parahaemolyticus]MCR9654276.1 phage recombination protein Bet [Vibrio parahaemolyticus]